jgi:ABC-2 type transport system permease protein
VFEGMRALLLEGTFRYDLFRNAVLLDIAYVALGAALFAAAVRSARKRGTLLQMGE